VARLVHLVMHQRGRRQTRCQVIEHLAATLQVNTAAVDGCLSVLSSRVPVVAHVRGHTIGAPEVVLGREHLLVQGPSVMLEHLDLAVLRAL